MSKIEGTHLYFAYGSNLNRDGMAARCPDCEPVRSAVLENWALTFRGVADVKPSPGSVAHGALWRISDRDLRRLDRYEGWPSLYRRELLAVRAHEEELVAITYVMNGDYVGLPSPLYYRSIAHGYKQWGLPLKCLEAAVSKVTDRLSRARSVRTFVPDGPKRLRPT